MYNCLTFSLPVMGDTVKPLDRINILFSFTVKFYRHALLLSASCEGRKQCHLAGLCDLCPFLSSTSSQFQVEITSGPIDLHKGL